MSEHKARKLVDGRAQDAWWVELGFTLQSSARWGGRDHTLRQQKQEYLRGLTPVRFVHGGHWLTLEEVRDALEKLEAQHLATAAAEAAERRDAITHRIQVAMSARGADDEVTEGPWAGFQRGQAIAWSWVLHAYEPYGFVHPNSEVRARRMHVLESGALPEDRVYPGRARALEERGLNPESYRASQERIGRPTFSSRDVSQ